MSRLSVSALPNPPTLVFRAGSIPARLSFMVMTAGATVWFSEDYVGLANARVDGTPQAGWILTYGMDHDTWIDTDIYAITIGTPAEVEVTQHTTAKPSYTPDNMSSNDPSDQSSGQIVTQSEPIGTQIDNAVYAFFAPIRSLFGLAVILTLLLCTTARADTPVSCTWIPQGICQVINKPFASVGGPYLTRTLSNSTAILYITNTDSSSHSFTLTAYHTANPFLSSYTGNTQFWLTDASTGFAITVAATSTIKVNLSSPVAAQLALAVSGASGSGSLIVYVQQLTLDTLPFISTNFSSTNSGTSATIPLQVISDVLSQSFASGISAVNPTAGTSIFAVEANNGAKSLYFNSIVASCSVACSISLNVMSSCTCSGSTGITNLKAGSAVTSTALAATTVTPTGSGLTVVNLAAGVPFIFDLRGVIAPNGGTDGLDILSGTTITGTMSVEVFWYER